MRKLAMMIALLMVIGAVPGWCLEQMVDGFVSNHTKDSSYQPVKDVGMVYGKTTDGITKGLDKVPVIKERRTILEPVEKMLKGTIDGGKLVINGIWDFVTFRSMREKKTPA